MDASEAMSLVYLLGDEHLITAAVSTIAVYAAKAAGYAFLAGVATRATSAAFRFFGAKKIADKIDRLTEASDGVLAFANPISKFKKSKLTSTLEEKKNG